MSLRFNWIKRLFNGSNAKWKVTFQVFIKDMKVQDIFFSRCFLTFDLAKLPLFYHHLIETWKEIQLTYIPSTGTDIMNEMIWHNNFITIQRKPIFFKHWYQRGVKFIRDIVDNNGAFLSEEELRNKYGVVTHFLEYYSLRSAIPGHWKQQIQINNIKIPEDFPFVYMNNTCQIISHLSSKQIYWFFIDSKFKDAPLCQTRWSEVFDVPAPDWIDIFKLSYIYTMETRLQSFQFSLLHRFVVHKSRLKNMGLVNSEVCDYCLATDSIIHRFVECDQVKIFWINFQDWWNTIHTTSIITLSSSDIIFGLYKRKKLYALNNCILQAKYFIHVQACKQNAILLINFLSYLKYKIQVERQVLYNQSKQELFTKHWGCIICDLYYCD